MTQGKIHNCAMPLPGCASLYEEKRYSLHNMFDLHDVIAVQKRIERSEENLGSSWHGITLS